MRALAGRSVVVYLATAMSVATILILLVGIGAGAIASVPPDEVDLSGLWHPGALLRTAGIALAIAVLSALFAVPGAWALRRIPVRWAPCMLAPLLLPAYLVHSSWNLLRAPGTWFGNILEGGSPERWIMVNHVQAIVGLALWAWPLSALVLSAWTTRIDRASLEALELHNASRLRSARVIARIIAPGMLLAIAVVFLLMLGSSVPLHLAQIETSAIRLWRGIAEGASQRDLWIGAAPLLILAVIGAWSIGRLMLSAGREQSQVSAEPDRRTSSAWLVGAGVVWCASAALPLFLFVREIPDWREFGRFAELLGESTAVSAAVASVVGLGVALVAIGANLGFAAPRGALSHTLAAVATQCWIIAAFIPGVLVGSAVLSAASIPPLNWLATSWAGVVVCHLARFAALGAVAGWWLAIAEPRALQDLERMFGADTLLGWFRAGGPARITAMFSVGIGGALLSLHEIEATVIAAPAGVPSLAERLLGMLHYLRDDQLSTAVVIIGGAGLLIACIAGMGAGRAFDHFQRIGAPRTLLLLMMCAAASAVPACDQPRDDLGRVPAVAIFGETGRGGGQFLYPRALDCAPDGSLWIVDKAGRVQNLTSEGEPLASWVMPECMKGKPVGLTAGADGLLYVADTHENRIAVFDVAGASPPKLLRAWGSYGAGPGEFIYPTDVAIVPASDGVPERIYVSEYGGNDRISAFDARGAWLFSFGALGYSDPLDANVRFSRPQAIMYEPLRREVLVADAANHRIGRFTLAGELIAWIGRPDGLPGRALGEFSYPYGLARLPDGSLLVAEYGACRVQHVDPVAGAGIETYGVPGRATGELVTPWAIAVGEAGVFVLDSGNDRVQVMRAPAAIHRRAQAP